MKHDAESPLEDEEPLVITRQQLDTMRRLAHKLAQHLTLVVGHGELALSHGSGRVEPAELNKVVMAGRAAAENLRSWMRLITEIEAGCPTDSRSVIDK